MPPLLEAGLIYALLSLDHFAVGPFLLSRPVVLGPLLGACLGQPALGLLGGVTAEFLWIGVSPVGVWTIDAPLTAALAVSLSALADSPGRAALVLALMLAVPAGILGKWLDARIRQANSRWIAPAAEGAERGSERPLARALLLTLGIWFLKGLALFVLCGGAGLAALNAALEWLPPRFLGGLDFAGRTLPVLGFCVALDYFFGRARAGLRAAWGVPGR